MRATAIGVGAITRHGSINKGLSTACTCGCDIAPERVALGYKQCLSCGEKSAQKRKFTVAPMPKSNYILITDLSLLKGLNSSHKGGLA